MLENGQQLSRRNFFKAAAGATAGLLAPAILFGCDGNNADPTADSALGQILPTKEPEALKPPAYFMGEEEASKLLPGDVARITGIAQNFYLLGDSDLDLESVKFSVSRVLPTQITPPQTEQYDAFFDSITQVEKDTHTDILLGGSLADKIEAEASHPKREENLIAGIFTNPQKYGINPDTSTAYVINAEREGPEGPKIRPILVILEDQLGGKVKAYKADVIVELPPNTVETATNATITPDNAINTQYKMLPALSSLPRNGKVTYTWINNQGTLSTQEFDSDITIGGVLPTVTPAATENPTDGSEIIATPESKLEKLHNAIDVTGKVKYTIDDKNGTAQDAFLPLQIKLAVTDSEYNRPLKERPFDTLALNDEYYKTFEDQDGNIMSAEDRIALTVMKGWYLVYTSQNGKADNPQEPNKMLPDDFSFDDYVKLVAEGKGNVSLWVSKPDQKVLDERKNITYNPASPLTVAYTSVVDGKGIQLTQRSALKMEEAANGGLRLSISQDPIIFQKDKTDSVEVGWRAISDLALDFAVLATGEKYQRYPGTSTGRTFDDALVKNGPSLDEMYNLLTPLNADRSVLNITERKQ